MHKRLIFSTILSVLVFGSFSSVKAEESDVYFDMSALDDLSPSAAYESAPAYVPDYQSAVPVHQPAEMVAPVPSGPITPVKVDVPLDSQTGAPVPVRQEPQFPTYVKPKVVPKPVPEKVAETPIPDPVVEPIEEEPISEESEVSVEQTSAEEIESITTEEPSVEPTADETNSASEDTPLPNELETEETKSNEPVAAEPQAEPEGVIPENNTPPETIEPLIPDSIPVNQPKSSSEYIVFEDDSITLTEANKQKIDSILVSFNNADSSKISILSYNYDDGQDAFKKKRQSLDRAVEVRAYLLSKGYKNFNNIKVINTNSDMSKKNVVEIKE